jgi:hypothetical protein
LYSKKSKTENASLESDFAIYDPRQAQSVLETQFKTFGEVLGRCGGLTQKFWNLSFGQGQLTPESQKPKPAED